VVMVLTCMSHRTRAVSLPCAWIYLMVRIDFYAVCLSSGTETRIRCCVVFDPSGWMMCATVTRQEGVSSVTMLCTYRSCEVGTS
jgi:hypothetical protein